MKITVLGSGAMATACSILLAEHPEQSVAMWARSAEHAAEMAATRVNARLLPDIPIPESVEITADIDRAVGGSDLLVVAIPTRYLREALGNLALHLRGDRPVVSVVKGLENDSFMRPSEIIADVLGSRAVVALGGPGHAEEFARRLPTSVVIAGGDVVLLQQIQQMFSTDRFRVYTNQDVIGVELAGALKNIVAIAAGICDGLGYGDNAKSALMTRGLVEMTRFGCALGAEAATFAGLAGIGDLITTCVSPYSRNRRVGERLGRGEKLAEIIAGMNGVAEGVTTTRSVHGLAESRGIEMPITREVFRVLFEDADPRTATDALMNRPPREE